MPVLLEDCSTVEEIIDLYENTPEGDENFESQVAFRVAEILAESDEKLANALDYYALMDDAVDYCVSLEREIREAMDALEEAYDAEEWDQMTDNVLFDWESDEAMADAAAEIDDVNLLLTEFKGFLHDIGESVAGLYGSDFDFGWDSQLNEAFFGDFWGTEMNMGKIQQAHGQMLHLLEKISELEERFILNIGETEMMVQEAVEEEWQKYTN